MIPAQAWWVKSSESKIPRVRVLILLAVIGVTAVIGFVGMAIMYGGMMGGMMTCCGGMAVGWLAGLLLIAAIVAAIVIWLFRRRAPH